MPSQPLDGLPLWAQILVTVIVGIGTLGIAFKGYLIKDKAQVSPSDPQSAKILAASIVDMGAIRFLSDTVIRLDASVQSLTRLIDEANHYERNSVEIGRELCARLRELREVMERRPS